MRPGEKVPGLAVDPSTLPAAFVSLIGLRWAFPGDSLVLVAPVADPRGVRLLYRSSRSTGGVYEAKIAGDSIQAVLPNKSSVVLSPGRRGHGHVDVVRSLGVAEGAVAPRRGAITWARPARPRITVTKLWGAT